MVLSSTGDEVLLLMLKGHFETSKVFHLTSCSNLSMLIFFILGIYAHTCFNFLRLYLDLLNWCLDSAALRYCWDTIKILLRYFCGSANILLRFNWDCVDIFLTMYYDFSRNVLGFCWNENEKLRLLFHLQVPLIFFFF